MTASLQSELGFLSNSVSSHVQNAEMGNQALNSLALISARYTHTALDVLSQLAAAHLLALCQALDLRAMHFRFLEGLEPMLKAETIKSLSGPAIFSGDENALDNLWTTIWTRLKKLLDESVAMESTARFDFVIGTLQPLLLNEAVASAESMMSIRNWTQEMPKLMLVCYSYNRNAYFKNGDASFLLGLASKKMYKFIRQELGVPFLHSDGAKDPGVDTGTVGRYVSVIYNAIRDGKLFDPVMETLGEIGWGK